MTKADIIKLADDEALMEVGRLAIENELIEWRDDRLQTMRNNGFSIREADGQASSIIRFGPEVGLRIALRAIAERFS